MARTEARIDIQKMSWNTDKKPATNAEKIIVQILDVWEKWEETQ